MTNPKSGVRRLAAHEYEFRSEWAFPADRDAVCDVLGRLEEYAQWWPQITRSESDGRAGRAVVHLRSALPFTLKLKLTREVEDRAAGVFRAIVTGDIEGFVAWSITETDTGTRVRFDQAVTLRHPVARRVDIVIRPLLQWNHAVAMRGCAEGLGRRLAIGSAA